MARKLENAHSDTFSLTLGERGRLVLPAVVRARLDLKDGARLALVIEDDCSLRLTPFTVAAQRGAGMFQTLAPGRSLSDELIAERRAEAARE